MSNSPSSISSISVISSPPSFHKFEDDEFIVWHADISPKVSDDSILAPFVEHDDSDEDFIVLSQGVADPNGKQSSISSADAISGHNRGTSSVSASSVDSLIPGMTDLTIESRSGTPTCGTTRKARRNRNRHAHNHNNKSRSTTSPNSTKVSDTLIKPVAPAKVPTPTYQQPKFVHPRSITAPSTKGLEPSIGFGERPIVDDISEYGVETSLYENAVQLMGSVLSSPDSVSQSSRLEILQALIVELGLVTSEVALPTTVSAARSFLRSHVYLNIIDYLAARDKGQEALQQVMHKNRGALIRDLRKRKKSKAPLTWVKETGLSVLLVQCYSV